MNEHAPGPWHLRPDPDDRDGWIIVDSTHACFRVCDVSPRLRRKEELHNARLIAAAPDMGALLKSWSSWYRSGQNPEQLPALGEWMRDTLAKAGL